MSLPRGFESAEAYLAASVRALRRYRRLYQRPNTHVLLSGALRLPLDGLRHLDVFADGFRLDAVPDNRFLREFCAAAAELSAEYGPFVRDEALERAAAAGPGGPPLGPKKRHEVVYLAREIDEMCARADCRTVVDLGSGLGYLDQRLYSVSQYRVLALEADERHHRSAERRQRLYHADSAGHVRFVRHTVTEDSGRDVTRLLMEEFSSSERFCIGGLHACADLAVHALRVFVQERGAALLALVPCCYHKMSTGHSFANFPLSASLRREFERARAGEFLSVSALRLAAQPRRPRGPPGAAPPPPPLRHLAFHLLARAALELYAHTHNCQIKRNKRKPVKAKATDCDFETYLRFAVEGFTLTRSEPAAAAAAAAGEAVRFDLDELRAIWCQITNSSTLKKAGILIILQNYLQDIIENLILFDRLLFLRENGIEKCYYKKILDDEISPRALALIAYK